MGLEGRAVRYVSGWEHGGRGRDSSKSYQARGGWKDWRYARGYTGQPELL